MAPLEAGVHLARHRLKLEDPLDPRLHVEEWSQSWRNIAPTALGRMGHSRLARSQHLTIDAPHHRQPFARGCAAARCSASLRGAAGVLLLIEGVRVIACVSCIPRAYPFLALFSARVWQRRVKNVNLNEHETAHAALSMHPPLPAVLPPLHMNLHRPSPA